MRGDEAGSPRRGELAAIVVTGSNGVPGVALSGAVLASKIMKSREGERLARA